MSKSFPSREIVERVRGMYPPGCRVELVSMNDPYTKLQPGDRGAVSHVDDTGTVFVDWESGSHLGAVYGVDSIRLCDESSGSAPHARFKRKGSGRIFTDSEENIAKIREMIREIDEYEYDYLPDDLVAIHPGYDQAVYNGKFYNFDLDKLAERCLHEGIPCRVVVAEEDS